MSHGRYSQVVASALLLSLTPLFISCRSVVLRETAVAPTFRAGEDPCPEGLRWTPVKNLSDEFNGNRVDLLKWQVDPLDNGWGWVGRPPGLFQAKNVSVNDGSMQVEVGVLEEPVVRKNRTFKYYGGIVRAIEPGQVGWYYECRMKANATEMSSTFWLMTKGYTVKTLEMDIQECVGKTSELTEKWGRNWDHIFHSNAIHRKNEYNPEKVQLQGWHELDVKNSSRHFVYGAWWKSPHEIRYYLDGKYMYSINPEVEWDVPAYLQMAIETYDWNPVPEDGGMIAAGTPEERTTKYDWIRTWKLVEEE